MDCLPLLSFCRYGFPRQLSLERCGSLRDRLPYFFLLLSSRVKPVFRKSACPPKWQSPRFEVSLVIRTSKTNSKRAGVSTSPFYFHYDSSDLISITCAAKVFSSSRNVLLLGY